MFIGFLSLEHTLTCMAAKGLLPFAIVYQPFLVLFFSSPSFAFAFSVVETVSSAQEKQSFCAKRKSKRSSHTLGVLPIVVFRFVLLCSIINCCEKHSGKAQ